MLKFLFLVCCIQILRESNGEIPILKRYKRQEDSGSCEFGGGNELSSCSWILSNYSQLEWQLGSGTTAFLLGGPKLDRYKSDSGGYVFMDSSAIGSSPPLISKRVAYLESAKREKTEADGTCLQFWYNINGLSAEGLKIILNPINPILSGTKSQIVLWEAKDSTGINPDQVDEDVQLGWQRGEVLYTYGYEHRLLFEGMGKSTSDPSSMYRGHVAVDSMDISTLGNNNPRACIGFCSFEGKLCDWSNLDDDDFNWQQAHGSLSRLTGPARDHGSFANGGGYIYIDSSYPRRPGDKARLLSPSITPRKADAPTCFRFYTHMYGSGIGSLVVKVLEDGEEKSVWEVHGDSGNQWHKGQVTVSSPEVFQIILEASVGKNPMGNIAVDDIVFLPGACPAYPSTAVSRQADCTFENEECNWINIVAPGQDQTDWQRISPVQINAPIQTNIPIVVRRMEPSIDHTSGEVSGYFLALERGGPTTQNGDRAMYVSPTFKESSTACLSFWASLHERSADTSGPGLGTMKVYIRPNNSPIMGPVGIPVWRLINYESPSWFNAQVPINYKDGPFRVIIEGTWGSTKQGSMAIDDITVYDNANCKSIPSSASVNRGECTFDKDCCEWKVNNGSSARDQWQLATPIRHPQTVVDHTYQSPVGYIYFDVYSPQNAVRTRLVGPEFSSIEGICLGFWFLPLGSIPETVLKVFVADYEDNELVNEREIWKVKMSEVVREVPEWLYGQTSVTRDGPFKISFEGESINGGFAIDDINVYTGECPTRPIVPKRDSGTKFRSSDVPTTTTTPTSPDGTLNNETTVEIDKER